eukprot:g2282.t1
METVSTKKLEKSTQLFGPVSIPPFPYKIRAHETSESQTKEKDGVTSKNSNSNLDSPDSHFVVSVHRPGKMVRRELTSYFQIPLHSMKSSDVEQEGEEKDSQGKKTKTTRTIPTLAEDDAKEKDVSKAKPILEPIPPSDVDSFLIILISQHSHLDLCEWGHAKIDREKDRLLDKLMEFASQIRNKLLQLSPAFWFDYIDPCSGLCVYRTTTTTSVWSEVQCFQTILNWRVQNAGCCKVLLHPEWNTSVYPSTAFTNAPLHIIGALLSGKSVQEVRDIMTKPLLLENVINSLPHSPSSVNGESRSAVKEAATTDISADDTGGNEGVQTINVNSNESVKLDHLGPIVINADGTTSRIANWSKLTPKEQEVTRRRIAKRNKQRREMLLSTSE